MSKQQPEKMKLTSMDISEEKREQLKSMFPEVFSEGKLDFDQLKRTLGSWVEPAKERFGLQWPGKADCMRDRSPNCVNQVLAYLGNGFPVVRLSPPNFG